MIEKWKRDLFPETINTSCANFAREYAPESQDTKKYTQVCKEVIRESVLNTVLDELDESAIKDIDELFKVISIKKSELTPIEDDIRKKISNTYNLVELDDIAVQIFNLDKDLFAKHPEIDIHQRLLLILDDIQIELVKRGSV